MAKFKVGDKVKVLNNNNSKNKKKNDMVGKVCEIRNIWDEDNDDYTVWQPDETDYWWFYGDQLELVLPYETIKITIKDKNTTVELPNSKIGKAHCKDDEYNEGIGVVIATARAYGVDLQKVADLVCKEDKKDLTELKSIIERAKQFLEKAEKQKYKITLKEFWHSEKTLGIHCNTEEEAITLLKAFDRLGKRWTILGDYYSNETNYETYKQNTVYSNNHRYGSVEFFNREKINVYEFAEVDLNN